MQLLCCIHKPSTLPRHHCKSSGEVSRQPAKGQRLRATLGFPKAQTLRLKSNPKGPKDPIFCFFFYGAVALSVQPNN